MFGPIGTTEYDLNFRTLGFPTRVHPSFWLVAIVMQWELTYYDPMFLLVYIAAWFVTVLIHELGHALMSRFYGYPCEIVLLYCGGFVQYAPHRHTTWRAVSIAFAGPAVNLLSLVPWSLSLWALQLPVGTWGMATTVGYGYLAVFVAYLYGISLWLAILNLLPVYPLDGGCISRSLFERFAPIRGTEYSLKLSIVVAVGVAAWAISWRINDLAVLFGFLAYMNVQELRGLSYRRW